MVGTWPSVAPKARAPRLPLLLLGLAAQRALGLRRPYGPNAQQERVVVEPGTKDDPYERAYHFDDYVSPRALKLHNLSSPLCFRDVSSSRSNCKFMSQVLCDRKSFRLEALRGGHRHCLARRQSCAVVGSSQHLLNESWGSFINSHDVVIRINGAPAGSEADSAATEFGSHVGTRTDARFVNSFGGAQSEEERGRPTCLFLHNPKIPEQCGEDCWRNPGLCNVSCSEPLARPGFCRKGRCTLDRLQCAGHGMTEENDWGKNYVFMDNFHGGIADQVVPHSTAGFKAVMYAMTICEKVSIFGFGPSCSGAVGARYYPMKGKTPDYWHHYDEEFMLLKRSARLAPNAIIPPEVRSMIHAQSVQVMIPACVDKVARRGVGALFQGAFGSGLAVNLLSKSPFPGTEQKEERELAQLARGRSGGGPVHPAAVASAGSAGEGGDLSGSRRTEAAAAAATPSRPTPEAALLVGAARSSLRGNEAQTSAAAASATSGFAPSLAAGQEEESGHATEGPLPPWQVRVVVKNATAGDPYEKASHSDDWVSITAPKYLNFSAPVFFRDVPSNRSKCTFMSQALFDSKSVTLESLAGEGRQCVERRQSCAVVGSSQHLLNASWGSFIDSQDVVIRINAAPAGTSGTPAPTRSKAKRRMRQQRAELSQHVGTRTDVRFVNHLGHLPTGERADLQPPRCLFLHNPWIPEACGKACWRNPGVCNVTCWTRGALDNFCTTQMCTLDELRCQGNGMTEEGDWGGSHVIMDNVHGAFADQAVPHSTAGFKAVIYAMTICDKVFVLGFGPGCSGDVGARYYSKTKPDLWHHYDEELMLLEKATRLGTDAMIPPEVRSMIHARSVELMVPPCVDIASSTHRAQGLESSPGGEAAPASPGSSRGSSE